MSKVCLITLGCSKNLVEAQTISGELHSKGIELTGDPSGASACVVHTCGFIEQSRKESDDVIRSLGDLKSRGELKRIVVSGCLAQLEKKALKQRFPFVDAVIGTGQLDKISEAVSGGQEFYLGAPGGLLESASSRVIFNAARSAYLRISEGCGHRCSFCAIPLIRGPYKSREKGSIVAEAKQLVAAGVRELVLIAQDTTFYGKDLYGKLSLDSLLGDLASIRDIKWIRLLYGYPSGLTDRLIEVIKNEEKVCKYLDLPVQHVNARILRLMKRPPKSMEILSELRDRIPSLALRSTVIVGFPGETEGEFEELRDFVSQGNFDELGVFEYSNMSKTGSFSFPEQVPEAVKAERRRILMLEQKKVVSKKNRMKIGSVETVLAEATGRGRTQYQAPEVDSATYFTGASKRRSGDFIKVKVTGFRGYDLIGKAV
jgi:ribosomal protein S12 methylthiotransferase